MVTNCDMCGTEIKDGKCSCGKWVEKDEEKFTGMRKAIEEFHEMKRFTLTGEAPHLGCAVVYFRGDFFDCKKVEAYIHKMKGRPYYE